MTKCAPIVMRLKRWSMFFVIVTFHIWFSFPVHLLTSDFFWLELHDWCKLNSPSCYVTWNIIFVFTIWAIWLGQNSLIFTGKFIPYHTLKQNVISHAIEFFFLSAVSAGCSSPYSFNFIRWSLTPFPYITLNIDGSLLGNPERSGAGCVARSANGEWLWGFSLHLGVTNNTMA